MPSITNLCNDLYDALNGHAIKDSVVIKLCCSVPQHVLVQVALRYQAMTGSSLDQILTSNTESDYRRMLARLCMPRQMQMLRIVRKYIVGMEDKRVEPAAAVMHLALVICTLSPQQLYNFILAYRQQYFTDVTEDIHEILRRLSLSVPDSVYISRIFVSLLSCARDDDTCQEYGDLAEKRAQIMDASNPNTAVTTLIELLCGRSAASVKNLSASGVSVSELLMSTQQKGYISDLVATIFKVVYYSSRNTDTMWAYLCDIAIQSSNQNLLADTILLAYDRAPNLREEYASLSNTSDIMALQNAINGPNPDYEQAVFNALIETGANLRE